MVNVPQFVGGRLFVRWDERVLRLHGEVKIYPDTVQATYEGTDNEGEPVITLKRASPRATLNVYDDGLGTITRLIAVREAALSFVTIDTRRVYTFGIAYVVGEPEFDPTTAKWSGLEVVAKYLIDQALEPGRDPDF